MSDDVFYVVSRWVYDDVGDNSAIKTADNEGPLIRAHSDVGNCGMDLTARDLLSGAKTYCEQVCVLVVEYSASIQHDGGRWNARIWK